DVAANATDRHAGAGRIRPAWGSRRRASRRRRPRAGTRDGDRLLQRPDLQNQIALRVLAAQRHRAPERRESHDLRFELVVTRRQADELKMAGTVGDHFVLGVVLRVREYQRRAGDESVLLIEYGP